MGTDPGRPGQASTLSDASIAVKFALAEDGSAEALELSAQPLQAPALILSETANAWWKAWRRGALDRESMAEAVLNLPGMFERLLDAEPVLRRAGALAVELDHPVCDCIYLAWAETLETPLITADERLQNKLATTDYSSLIEALK